MSQVAGMNAQIGSVVRCQGKACEIVEVFKQPRTKKGLRAVSGTHKTTIHGAMP